MRTLILALGALLAPMQSRPPLRLTLEYSIGDASGLSLGAIQRIDLTADGGVVAVDGANGVIYRFTPAGKLRDSLGHKGQGPGEFLLAAGMAVGPAGEVAIADMRTRRFTIWEASGALRGSTPLSGMPVDLVWRGADPVVGLVFFAPDTIRIRFGPARLGEDKLGPEIAVFPDPPIAQFVTAVSCGSCRHAMSNLGRLLVAAPDTFYRVSELDARGAVMRSWKRSDAGAGLRTQEELTALRNRIAAGPGGGRPLPGMEARLRPPDDDALRFRSRFQGIGMDDKGRLLALVSNAGSTTPVLDVFSGDGKFLGSVLPPRTLQSIVVRGNRLVALSETLDGTPAILVYRIED